MRIKALLRYHFATTKIPIGIFYLFYMLGTLLGSVAASVAISRSGGASGGGWNSSLVSFTIFMLISSLIASQKETRFLITRSVSRKEIFFSNMIFLLPLAGILTLLQLVSITLDSGVRFLLGGASTFRGIEQDIQIFMAPNMNNVLVFCLVSFSFLLLVGAWSFLLGSCMARWKVPTIGVLVIAGLILLGSMMVPRFFSELINILKFLFIDEQNAFILVLKYLILALVAAVLAFFASRRITAAKQA